MTITIFHSNASSNAVVGGGSWEPNSPLSYLQDPRPTSKARSTDAQLESTQLNVAFQRSTPLIGIQLVSTNLQSGAKVKVTAFADALMTSVIFTHDWEQIGDPPTPSLDLPWSDPNWWSGIRPYDDPDNAGQDVLIFFGQTYSAKYWLIEIDNTGNTEGYIEIGVLFMGEAFVPTMNFAPDSNSFKRVSRTSFADAANGSRYFTRRRSSRALRVAWPALPSDEVLGEIDEMVRLHDIDRQFYVVTDPDRISTRQRTSFLATLSQLPEHSLQNVFFNNDIGASAGFEFLESI